jgi:hypothetical protein
MRNTLRNSVFAAATLIVAGIGAANAAVVNGGFELDAGTGFYGRTHTGLSGQTGGWDVFANVPGWRTGGDGLEHQTQPTLGLAPIEGNYYVELAGNQPTTIAQTLTLAAGKYVLSFLYASRASGDGDNNAVDWALTQVSALARSVVGPIVSGTEVAIGADLQWRKVEVAFEITDAGDYDLSFGSSGVKPTIGGLIDDVQLTPAAVPLPAAGLMLLGAVGGLAAMRRRKRA